MALVRDRSRAQLAFQVTGREVDEFEVMRYRGTEGLCQLYRFEIEMATQTRELNFKDFLGKGGVLSINGDKGERWFHGVIGRMEYTGDTVDQYYYRVELYPAMWLLTHRHRSRIFQNKSTKEILTQVLEEGGISGDAVKLEGLKATYDPREYCVQYRETDYNFIARLMEEEGIWWCFEHTRDGHTLIIADNPAAHAAIAGERAVPFAAPSGLTPAVGRDEEHVNEFRLGQAVRPGGVVLTDFDFTNPGLDLTCRQHEPLNSGLQISDFPGEHATQSRGAELARIRLEELATYRTVGSGRSNCRRLACGRVFTLLDHPAAEVDGDYLVTSVTHSGRQADERAFNGAARGAGRGFAADDDLRTSTHRLYHQGAMTFDPANGVATTHPALAAANGHAANGRLGPHPAEELLGAAYECAFECIPADTAYRPARITRRPIIHGTQTARVVGPATEEIHTDEFGRVRVQFHWDRQGTFAEDSSCWIRVCHGMAGGQYGMLFLPRVGQEVVVDFLEGDPDKPLIVGRVYNADHMPPYPLPQEKTKSCIKTHSSKGGRGTNEIRFEDLDGREQLFIQAQRQMDTRVKATHYHTTGGSYHLHVGGEHEGQLHGEYREKVFKAKHVHVQGEQRTWIEEDESRVVGGDALSEVQGARASAVIGDVLDRFDLNHKHEVQGTYHLDAGLMKVVAPGGIEFKCGSSSIVLSPAGVFIEGPLINIANGPGPAVPPVQLIVTGPAAPEEAAVADRSEPGRDTRYDRQPDPDDPTLDPSDGPVIDDPATDDPRPADGWIEITLHDKQGRPVRHEPFRLLDGAGREHRGRLDREGYARVTGITSGLCKVTFPRRDFSVWQRAAVGAFES